MKKTVVVTGIKGFLGSHLWNALKDEFTVLGIGRQTEEWNGTRIFSLADFPSEVEPEFVILCHAAVSSGQEQLPIEALEAVNVVLTHALVQRFNDAKLIYCSTVSIYQESEFSIVEKGPEKPQSSYAITKQAGEKSVFTATNAVVVRFSSLYGIGMKTNTIVPLYIQQALQQGVIQIWGKGERRQNYIHVTDAVTCIQKVIECFDTVNHQVLLGVHHKEYSNFELGSSIAQLCGATLQFVHEDFSKSWRFDNQITQKLLNWKPQVELQEGLSHYIAWKKRPF